ncbi:glycosyltransferase family 2 protein [Nocardioides mangrovicus]|uniref:Glycosyltransferase family 2 protein n=1 Tax=Nocardioides mangrovicus TaxID=2478913 RepID=A0A3L8P281_9ACTN|nr:glycosyltransferase family 2 protein [Nocardioides mangrovicus]RLV49077.1 glycosyltransferase family 2 protein [Nocardioides mangrovicus]
MSSCDVVIPCRDEAGALPALLSQVPEEFGVVVVDNGSTDGTGEVASAHGARVVREERPGYGAAVHAGLEAASADLVAVLDGDGSMDPRELPAMVRRVESGEADLVCGRRRPVGRGVWPWHARAGNVAVLWWLRRRTGLAVHDIAPMRVARRAALLELGVEDRRFGYPVELLTRAQRAGWRMVEVDVSYRPRAAGTRSKVSGSVRGSLRAARDFARVLP